MRSTRDLRVTAIAFASGESACFFDYGVRSADFACALLGHLTHAFRQTLTGQFVRVVLAHQAAVGLLDLHIGGGGAQAQGRIGIIETVLW
jgi:hypothetical protein